MKTYMNKTNTIIALFATTLFSTAAIAAVPKTTLVQVESINQLSLIKTAHTSLKSSMAPIKISFSKIEADPKLVKQKQNAQQNKSVTLVKTSLIAE